MATRLTAARVVACALTGAALWFDGTAPVAAASTASVGQKQAPADPGAAPAATYRAVLDQYCVTCHNSRLRTANLALDATRLDSVGADAEVWEKVLLKLEMRTMPPPGRRARPDPITYAAFASWLEAALDQSAADAPDPGRPSVHRLNRTEYTNTIRDLLALEIDGPALLPADDLSFGFDNNADLLNVSPALMERYVSAAHKISRLAIGNIDQGAVIETYDVTRTKIQDTRASEALPFGSRGGFAVRHYFPLDAEYVLSARLQRDVIGNIYGLAREQRLEIRVDGKRVAVFAVGGDLECLNRSQAGSSACIDADAHLTVRVPVNAGARQVGVTFLRRTLAPEGVTPRRLPVSSFILSSTRDLPASERMGVMSIAVDGPHDPVDTGDTPSRRQVFICRPAEDDASDEERCAHEILSRLARGAYRRPVTEADATMLVGFFKAGRQRGGFDAGIRRALTRILVDPEFLFRVEADPPDAAPGTPYRLGDLELASRLSFFLWSSLPDDELLDLAADGMLSDPATLERQVRRMLADRRSTALVTNFAAQWLHLRNMRRVTPDVNQFPEFDDNLREAFQRETELFVESQLREDRGVADLLTASYTFVNERLARHYGIRGIYGSRFRRVTLDPDGGRGGLLGHGSILTATSHATRTSPVLRGKWVLENILGAPPPPPPADVPALDENHDAEAPRSVRERLEQHRANPVCASCHARMDPLGFALENFDGIGRWRTSDSGVPLDTSATLPDGTGFDGPAELRARLKSRHEAFVRTVTGKLLTYALGRGVEHYDQPSIRRIVRDAGPDHRWSAIILGIVRSVPFTMRRSES